MYLVEKNINRLYNFGYTYFLDNYEFNQVKGHLKKEEYSIYKPYNDSEKVILYKKEPDVFLYEIKTNNILKHQDIMGSLYNLNLDKSLFGDIVITNNKYYFYVLGIISDEIERSFNKVGRFNIEIERVNLDVLSNYEREYESIELIVSSLRIDTVISKIINSNRSKVKDLISDKDIMLNYNCLKNNSYNLHPGDIFSIRRFGKYKFIDIKKNTKSGNLIIEIYKYI